MHRYWRVYRQFFTSSFARELEFRANFIAKIIQNAGWVGFFVLLLFVIYGNTNAIAGWSRADSLVLAGTLFLMSACAQAAFFSLTEIPEQVRTGMLDYVVTRPIDSQFWVSSRRFNFDQLGSIFAGGVMVVAGIISAHLHPGFIAISAYLCLTLAGLAIFYSFNLALMTLGIWLVRVDNLWVLSESVTSIARYPLDIYSGGIQRILTFIVPLAFLATIPARQMVSAVDPTMVAVGVGWAMLCLWLSRSFWKFGMRHYSSASS